MHSPFKTNVLQNKINRKTKARFSRLLWHPAWKRKRAILVSVLHKFVPHLLKTLNHLLTGPEPT